MRDIHILGLSEYELSYAGGRYHGKLGSLFDALNASRCPVSTVYYPRLQGLRMIVNRAFAFQPNLERWRHGDTMNAYAFTHRSRLVEDLIRSHPSGWDLIFQLHSVFAPGIDLADRPYVVMTDNTYTLSQRYWPDWAPARTRGEARHFIQLESQVYHQARFVFVMGEFVRRELIDEYGVAPERVVVIHPGNTLERPARHTPADAQYASKTALFVGYEFERKGGPLVLEAWKQVVRKFPNAKLLVAGPDRRLVPAQDGVEWVGRIDHNRLFELLQQASVFVMPSLFEPFGLVYFEAMGMGVPCIAANRYGIVDCIQDGYNGLLVPCGEVEPIAEALITLFGDEDLAARLGRQARQTVHQNFTWQHVMARMRPYLLQALT